jgi:hypothetical protein
MVSCYYVEYSFIESLYNNFAFYHKLLRFEWK